MPDEAAPAPAEQPEGGGDASGGLYDLASVPEEQRSLVEPHLKAIEANITKKLQENADYRKQWAPYEELGIADVDPQALQQLLEFADMAQDETRFEQWFRQIGDERGWLGGDEEDDSLDLEDEFSPDKIQDMIAKAVTEATEPLQQDVQERKAKEAEQAALAEITEQLDALKAEHGDDLDTDAIVQLSIAYVEDDPDNAINRGAEDYFRLVGKGEADLFAKKVDQPATPEGPGSANHAPERITTFEDAKAAAAERLRALNAT